MNSSEQDSKVNYEETMAAFRLYSSSGIVYEEDNVSVNADNRPSSDRNFPTKCSIPITANLQHHSYSQFGYGNGYEDCSNDDVQNQLVESEADVGPDVNAECLAWSKRAETRIGNKVKEETEGEAGFDPLILPVPEPEGATDIDDDYLYMGTGRFYETGSGYGYQYEGEAYYQHPYAYASTLPSYAYAYQTKPVKLEEMCFDTSFISMPASNSSGSGPASGTATPTSANSVVDSTASQQDLEHDYLDAFLDSYSGSNNKDKVGSIANVGSFGTGITTRTRAGLKRNFSSMEPLAGNDTCYGAVVNDGELSPSVSESAIATTGSFSNDARSPRRARKRRKNEWNNDEVVLLLNCTKLLIDYELKTVAQALFELVNRDPGKCWGRAAEKKLKRMKIFTNWKTCDKKDVARKIDEKLAQYRPLCADLQNKMIFTTNKVRNEVDALLSSLFNN